MKKLSEVDLSKKLSKEEYKKILKEEEIEFKLLKAQLKVRDNGMKVLIVFEGWDASGKGGTIRRLTEPMDPRGYSVHSISAPNEMEKSKHYLWRFWEKMPSKGEITIFDRSWYGRVLVERIEGFAKETEWKRAYDEINWMERTLVNDDTILLKFFMHISKDEQQERFEERMKNPLKRYKIGKEDFRNRARWEEYITAYDEMFEKTSTDCSEWHIIEANDKDWARLSVMRRVIKEIGE